MMMMLPFDAPTGSVRTPKLSAADRLLELLQLNDAVCATDLSREISWAFGSRLADLRRDGHRIEKRRCRDVRHLHNGKARIFEYYIVEEPES